MTKRLHMVYIVLIQLTLLSGCAASEKSEMKTNIEPRAAATVNSTLPIAQTAPPFTREETISYPEGARRLLIEGNDRFQTGEVLSKDISFLRRTTLAQNGQHPFAVIVSCSDSRVPPEIIFDQALGDLFVIRVAGNVITPVELGSIEYAVEHLNTPLVLVLGHEQCGAVTAVVEGGEYGGSIPVIADKIKPAVQRAKEAVSASTEQRKELIEKSTELNVFDALGEITKSPVIKHALERNLRLYGGKYLLESGEVVWYDGTDQLNALNS